MSQADAQVLPRPLVVLAGIEVLARMSTSYMLERHGFRVMPVASAEEALKVLGAAPDTRVVVTDVELSADGMNGFELARKVHEEHRIGVVVVSGPVSSEVNGLPPGARFLAKPLHEATLAHLVRDLADHEPKPLHDTNDAASAARTASTLTPRQHEVLALLVQGKSNQQIADAMGLSANTVKVHLVTIFRVLGVHSRAEALLAGMERLKR